MTDRQLVDSFLKTRSEKAFVTLYRSKTPHLYQMALRLCGRNEDEAQECVQEMWIVAIRKLHQFLWKSTLKTWLTAILINTARSRWRKAKMEVDIDLVEKVDIPDYHSVSDLEDAIASLAPGHREIVLLHDVEGYKHHEIADMLDISQGTSKSQLHYARLHLRKYLEDYKTAKG